MNSSGELTINMMISAVIGILLLIGISIYIIGKPIPESFRDMQSIEKELTAQLGTKNTQPQTTEDAAFLKTYGSFVKSLDACASATQKNCWCYLNIPPSFPQQYHIFLGHDPLAGYYAYAYVLRDNKKVLLKDRDLLFEKTSTSSKGYLFRTDDWHTYPTQQVDISTTSTGQLQFLTPSKDVPATIVNSGVLGIGRKELPLFTYSSDETILIHKTPQQEITFIPSYDVYPALHTQLGQLSECVPPSP